MSHLEAFDALIDHLMVNIKIILSVSGNIVKNPTASCGALGEREPHTRLRRGRFHPASKLTMDKLFLEDGIARVLRKGNKERMIPFVKQVQRLLWRYIECSRPEPSTIHNNFVFLNEDGRRIEKRRIQQAMTRYGKKAKLVGVRCSPHTLRHTAAISFLRNCGDLFSLQRLLGHNSLEMTR